jgi:hypothetical protein
MSTSPTGTRRLENGGDFPRRPHTCELDACEPSQGEETVDLVHHAPCRRSMDQERWSTVSHTE